SKLLVCPFSSDQERWLGLECINVHDGKKYKMLDCTETKDVWCKRRLLQLWSLYPSPRAALCYGIAIFSPVMGRRMYDPLYAKYIDGLSAIRQSNDPKACLERCIRRLCF